MRAKEWEVRFWKVQRVGREEKVRSRCSDEVDLNPSSSVLPRSVGSGLLPHRRFTATASYQYQTGCPLDCRQDEKQAVLLLARSSSTPFLLPSLPSFPPSTLPSTPLLLIPTLPPQPQSKLGLTFSSSQPGPQRVDLCLSRVLTQRSQEISKLILSDRASSLLVEQRESLFGRILSYKPRVREKRREDVSGTLGEEVDGGGGGGEGRGGHELGAFGSQRDGGKGMEVSLCRGCESGEKVGDTHHGKR